MQAHGEDDHQFFAVNAAASLELLMKAALCQRHPALIAGPKFDSLLHACDLSDAAQSPRSAMRTVGGAETLERAIRVVPDLRSHASALRPLIENRNGVIHLGEPAVARELWLPFLRASGVLLLDLEVEPGSYWAEYADLVEKAVQEGVRELEIEVERRIAAAAREFARRFEGLDESGRRAAIRAIESSYVPTRYEQETAQCPACNSEGVMDGFTETRWEMEADGDASFIAEFSGSYFLCRVCGLELDGDELEISDVETDVPIDDADPGDFYEPEYDGW